MSLTVREKRANRKRAKATQGSEGESQPGPAPSAPKRPRRNVAEKTYFADKPPAVVVRRNPVKDPPVPRLPGQDDILSSDDDIFATRRALQKPNGGTVNTSASVGNKQVSCHPTHPFGPPPSESGIIPAALENAAQEDAQIIPPDNHGLPSFEYNEADWQNFLPDISAPPSRNSLASTATALTNHTAMQNTQPPPTPVRTARLPSTQLHASLESPDFPALPNIVVQGATPLPIDRRLPVVNSISAGVAPNVSASHPDAGFGVPPPAPNFTATTTSDSGQSTDPLALEGPHPLRDRSLTALPQETRHSRSRSTTPLPDDLLHPASATAIAQALPPVIGRAPSEGLGTSEHGLPGSGRTSRSHSPAANISLRHVRATIAAHHAARPEPRVRRGSHSYSNSRAVTPSIDTSLRVSSPMLPTVNPPTQITNPAPPNASHVATASNPPPPATLPQPLPVAETHTGGGCSTHKPSRTVTLSDLPASQQILVPGIRVSILFQLVAYGAWPVQLTPILEKALEYAKSIPYGIPVSAVTLTDPFKKHLSGKPAAIRGEVVKQVELVVERDYKVSPSKRSRLNALLANDAFLYDNETVVPLQQPGFCENEALVSVINAILFGQANIGMIFIEELCGADGPQDWHAKLKDKTATKGLPIGLIAFAAVITRHILECIRDRDPSKRKTIKFEQTHYGPVWTRYRKQLIKYRFLGPLRLDLMDAVKRRYNEENPEYEGSETDSSNFGDDIEGGNPYTTGDTDLDSNHDEETDDEGAVQ